jgi:hypothetical protein
MVFSRPILSDREDRKGQCRHLEAGQSDRLVGDLACAIGTIWAAVIRPPEATITNTRSPTKPGAPDFGGAELPYVLAFATTALRHGLSATIASNDARMLAPAAIRNTLSQFPDVCCT